MPIPPENLLLFTESITSLSTEPFYFEGLARKKGYRLIAGVDEAGRGPLAGPVVAAAAILGQNDEIVGVKDSKQMREKDRESAFSVICQKALAVGIGVVSSKAIDETNILKASLEAMRVAVAALAPKPDFVLVDGICAIPLQIPQRCLKKGDQLSHSIAAASVLAKVYRDRIMRCFHDMYPAYGFDRHKGYGTARHLKAINQYGPCPIHRMSFKGVT